MISSAVLRYWQHESCCGVLYITETHERSRDRDIRSLGCWLAHRTQGPGWQTVVTTSYTHAYTLGVSCVHVT